jgi:hypothetical protein
MIETRPQPSLVNPSFLSLQCIRESANEHSIQSKLSEFNETSFGSNMFLSMASPYNELPNMKQPRFEA